MGNLVYDICGKDTNLKLLAFDKATGNQVAFHGAGADYSYIPVDISLSLTGGHISTIDVKDNKLYIGIAQEISGLDPDGFTIHVPINVQYNMKYVPTPWDASTKAFPADAFIGHYYRCSVAGSIPLTDGPYSGKNYGFAINDLVVHTGNTNLPWMRIPFAQGIEYTDWVLAYTIKQPSAFVIELNVSNIEYQNGIPYCSETHALHAATTQELFDKNSFSYKMCVDKTIDFTDIAYIISSFGITRYLVAGTDAHGNTKYYVPYWTWDFYALNQTSIYQACGICCDDYAVYAMFNCYNADASIQESHVVKVDKYSGELLEDTVLYDSFDTYSYGDICVDEHFLYIPCCRKKINGNWTWWNKVAILDKVTFEEKYILGSPEVTNGTVYDDGPLQVLENGRKFFVGYVWEDYHADGSKVALRCLWKGNYGKAPWNWSTIKGKYSSWQNVKNHFSDWRDVLDNKEV